ncbi:DMT family transporter [Vagococcus sp.]|uniref:DMT family transporter n=1 Tax=Vagococcus sp. TaxID=1933889 RepID=UPI003F9AFD3C
MMAWVSLVLAGIFEMFGVNAINTYLKNKTRANIIKLIAFFVASFLLLSFAMKSLPMSTAYAIWTGIGASGGAVLGIIIYGEPRNIKRLFFISLILISAIGLKIIS